MKISIIISTYNGEKYIFEQLDSIYNQTRQPDEVIIYDDCSTDNTVKVIKKYICEKRLEKNWKITINTVNKGWRSNFMHMIWQATGDLIFTCDQDDIWRNDKLAIMENIMKKNPNINLLASNYIEFYDDGKEITGPYANDKIIKKIKLKENFLKVPCPGCTYCIRKNLAMDSQQLWEEEFAHDDLFWRLGLFSDSLYIYTDSLIRWRKHRDSAYSLESIELKSISEKINWLKMTKHFDVMLIQYCYNKKIDNRNLKLRTLKKNLHWLSLREKFYITKNIYYGVKLLLYIRCYQRYRQYLGDWYLIYIKK